MIFTDLFESRDICRVCGQTPCNCTHIMESAQDKDMTGQTCEKCKKGKYQERSQHDDMQGKVTCKCGHRVDRWKSYKEQGVAEGSQPNDIAVYHHTGPDAETKAKRHAMKLGSEYGHFKHDMADKNDNLHVVTQKRYFPAYAKQQGVAEAFIAPALSAANAAAEHLRGAGGYRGRVDVKVGSREEYMSALKTLRNAAQQAGQHIEVGRNGSTMSVFSDSMGSDELVQFVDNTLSQGVAEGSEQIYKVVALTKSNALAKPTKMKVKADSIKDLFGRLAANDWYPLEINGVEVIAGKRLKQGVAEGAPFGFGDRFSEQLALQTFEVNPNLNDENKILNLGYKIAKGYMGSRAAGLFRDEDFPSDFVSAYGYLQKQDLEEGWKDKLAGAALAGAMAFGGAGRAMATDAPASPDQASPAITKVQKQELSAETTAFADRITDPADKEKFLELRKKARRAMAVSISAPSMRTYAYLEMHKYFKFKNEMARKYNIGSELEESVAEAEKNPHTSALGKALYRDLSKEKKASPAQVTRNQERWAQRQKAKAEQPPTKGMSNAEKVDKGWRNPNVDEGETTRTSTGLVHRATNKYGAGDEPFNPHNPGKYVRDLDSVNKQQVKDLDASMGINWKSHGPKGIEIDEVSDATLTSYLTKVDADSQKHEKDPTKRSPEKRNRSVAGFARAFNKLDARREKTNEVSLGDYPEKARASSSAAMRGAMSGGSPEERNKQWDIRDRRQRGLARAEPRIRQANISRQEQELKDKYAGVDIDAAIAKLQPQLDQARDDAYYGGSNTYSQGEQRLASLTGKMEELQKAKRLLGKELDEVSKQKLGDYLHAAHKNVVDRASSDSFQSGRAGDKYNKADVSAKEQQREKGMARAISRLTREGSSVAEAWARRYPNLHADIAECEAGGDTNRLKKLMAIKNIIDSDLGEQSGLGFGQ